ncbi:MAG: hypothetical protein ACREMY_08695, partial [bacterium]
SIVVCGCGRPASWAGATWDVVAGIQAPLENDLTGTARHPVDSLMSGMTGRPKLDQACCPLEEHDGENDANKLTLCVHA